MRCGEPLPPESLLTTTHAEASASVTIYARSVYRGRRQEEADEPSQHSWEVEVELQNVGSSTIQLMTRHTVATSADGSVEEIKLPGAFGKLPVLAPGERFEARGKTRLATPYGALHGSYQFELLSGPSAGQGFSANMGRLLLSDGSRAGSKVVPCSPEADVLAPELPTTSVYNSYRLISGATVAFVPALSEPALYDYAFEYDVQIQNARPLPVVVHAHEWTVLDARGVTHSESGVGLGGAKSTGKVRIPPGRGTRHQGTFRLPTTTGIAAARFLVTLDEADPDGVTYELVVAPMGVSVDGRPVPPIEPAGFLTGSSASHAMW